MADVGFLMSDIKVPRIITLSNIPTKSESTPTR